MINKDILKKINDIYKSGKTIDEDSIKELGYLYAIENGLEEYVRDIQIKEDFEDSGVYKAGSKEVKLNFSVIDDDVIGMYKPKTTEDYTYCFNYQAIKDLLHEIQHADQEHLYEYRYKPYNHFEDRKFFITISALDFLYNAASTTDESSYEYRKLSIGKPADKSYKEHLLDLYNELYTVIPTERMAELEACIEIREILKEIGKFNPEFGLGENYKLFFQAYGITGEKKKVYPTEVYYDIFAYEDDTKKLVEGYPSDLVHLTPQERFYLGLPVSQKEYSGILVNSLEYDYNKSRRLIK